MKKRIVRGLTPEPDTSISPAVIQTKATPEENCLKCQFSKGTKVRDETGARLGRCTQHNIMFTADVARKYICRLFKFPNLGETK